MKYTKEEKQLLELYDLRKDEMGIWGSIVKSNLIDLMKEKNVTAPSLQWVSDVRIKTDKSFLDKALHRNKMYKDPINEIEDYVGFRIILLLKKHCRIVEKLINSQEWAINKARDFQLEIENEPSVFDYQSDHYIIRPIGKTYKGSEFQYELSCELQVRTLMQHAYAEVTHDLLYKGLTSIKYETKRTTVRGMALSETTDVLFDQVDDEIQNDISTQNEILNTCFKSFSEYYPTFTKNIEESRKHYNKVSRIIENKDVVNFGEYIDINSVVLHKQLQKINDSIKEEPIVLFLLYLVSKRKRSLHEIWHLDYCLFDDLVLLVDF